MNKLEEKAVILCAYGCNQEGKYQLKNGKMGK
jgi:hypothetical protein